MNKSKNDNNEIEISKFNKISDIIVNNDSVDIKSEEKLEVNFDNDKSSNDN